MDMIYTLLLLTVPAMSYTFSSEDSPYCSVRYKRLCTGKGPHVGCQYAEEGPGAACVNHSEVAFSPVVQRMVVHYINRRRQKVAAGLERAKGGMKIPPPKLMMLVKWDQELAFLAQRLANQCTFMHDECRATVKYPYAGQAVGEVRWRKAQAHERAAAGVRRAVSRVLDAWWGERRRVSPAALAAPFRLAPGPRGTLWGHFSQLAVWSLQAVGCGAIRHFDQYSRLLLVCDFSHTNMLGQRTLPTGPRADCPVHFARKSRSAYPLLCAPVQYPLATEGDTEEESYNDYGDEHEAALSSTRSTTAAAGPTRSSTKRTTVDDTTESEQSTQRTSATPEPTEPTSRETVVTRSRVTQTTDHTEFEETTETRRSKYLQEVKSRSTVASRVESKLSGRFRYTDDSASYLCAVYRFKEQKEKFDDDVETTKQTEPHKQRAYFETKLKPKRPSVSAFSLKPPALESLGKSQSRHPVSATLALDKEDMIQLFKDTGYSLKPANEKNQ